ncbi:MAG TPA: FKBP-type peptidyl-prolyl cis-trans isomerase N-terminal domain-containing protein [Verrucomicrobiales bacterium]|nr:FKBP-type peptidyl-prolyl cis-trans isomerase N-terminal domain-containing protein [Verrucomicrobiales bacterium]
MKLSLYTFTLTAVLAALPLTAQETPPKPAAPPPAAPAPVPGTPPTTPAPKVPGTPAAAQPGQPGQPGLLPSPNLPPPPPPDSFKSEKDRLSYALGLSFSNNLKSEEQRSGTPLPKPDDVLAGMKDVFSGGKSLDYVIGAHLASQIKRTEVEVDVELLSQAIRDALTNSPPKLNPEQLQAAMRRFQDELRKKRDAKVQAENAAALQASMKFLESNAKGEGIKQTASGLQYKIEKQGEGKSPTESDLVTMNFKSTLLDTTLVEKSPETGPARKVMKVLPQGLREGLALLKTGGKATYWLPPALAYGEQGKLGLVKANSVVVYEVELLGVEPAPKPQFPASTPGQPGRQPVTAVTPPITVEIPPKPGEKPAVPVKPGEKPPKPPEPPIPPVKPAQSTPPISVPPAPPAPAPAPPEKK